MKDLIYHFPRLDEKLSKVYNILSESGFDILIEDGQMSVWYSGSSIELDIEEGMVIVPEHYYEEYQERQEHLYEQ